MPRRYTKKRVTRRKPKTLSKPQQRQVAKIARRVDNQEKDLKYIQYDFQTNISDSWTGPANFLYYPVQGIAGYVDYQDLTAGQSQRLANEITIKSIQFNYTLYQGDDSNVVRMIIFQWMQQDISNFPIVGDIVMGTGGTAPWLEPRNYQNKANYKILYDHTHNLSAAAGNNSVITRHVQLAGKLKLKNLKASDNNTNGFGATLIKGNIYYMFVSDSSVVSHPSITMKVRLLFTDA